MSVHLDASVLVALFTTDIFSERAEAALRGRGILPAISDFAAAEFASVIARNVRRGGIVRDNAETVFATSMVRTMRARAICASAPSSRQGAAARTPGRVDAPSLGL